MILFNERTLNQVFNERPTGVGLGSGALKQVFIETP
jgi:hypothetical protein